MSRVRLVSTYLSYVRTYEGKLVLTRLTGNSTRLPNKSQVGTWHSISGSSDSSNKIEVCALSGEIVYGWKVLSFFSAERFSLSFCKGFAIVIK